LSVFLYPGKGYQSLADDTMAHPLIPPILELVTPTVSELGLEVVQAVFQTNHSPPILRIDIRNPAGDTGLDDCERASRAIEAQLEATNLIEEAYVLELSSPGLSNCLTTDRDFISFRGFPVLIRTQAPFQGQQEWVGRLIDQDETSIRLNLKGRAIAIPKHLVEQVLLQDQL
jgi:ribosome maturation factor RimP